VSVWEILLKRNLGKLRIEEDSETIIRTIRQHPAWRILPLDMNHVDTLNQIASFSDHADPFDRILLAQARSENLRIMTADVQFSRYGIEVIW
jgi:PIN domain nuclease of toxin-antitoxin system